MKPVNKPPTALKMDILPGPETSAQNSTDATHATITLAQKQLSALQDIESIFGAFLISCRVEGLSPFTVMAYKNLAGELIKFLSRGGITDPKMITPTHIRLFILEKQKTCQPVSIHSYYRHTKRFFNWMVAEGILELSPMINIKPPRVPQTMIKPFQVEDLRRMLFLCDEQTFVGARNKSIILLFIDTGLRLAELTRIDLANIDFDRGIIKVMGKGARERVVHMSQRTEKAMLRYMLKRDDNLPCLWLTQQRKPLTKWGVVQIIRILGQRAELKNVRCSAHTFRHTAATLALESGALEFEVQAMLGHSTLAMTRRYVSSLNSEKAAEAHKRFSPVQNLKLG